jgi:uncharacterized protein YoxC
MKALKIYSFITTITIVVLSIYLYQTKKEYKETEEVLQQCSDRYYQEISK